MTRKEERMTVESKGVENTGTQAFGATVRRLDAELTKMEAHTPLMADCGAVEILWNLMPRLNRFQENHPKSGRNGGETTGQKK